MKFSVFIITLITCQYFISQIAVHARPQAVQKMTWPLSIDDDNRDRVIRQSDKRKGSRVGWGKRNDFMMVDRPYQIHENSARTWFDDK